MDPAIGKELLLNLENYKSDNIIKCAVLAYLVHQNTDLEQCINASKLFRAIDIEHDGKLERKELVGAYKTYLNLNDQQATNKAEYVFKHIDNDNNGTIESEEFIRACINPSIFAAPNYLRAAFNYFDDDGGGTISLDEVEEKFFQNSNQSQKAKEKLRAMFDQIDTNKDEESTHSTKGKKSKEEKSKKDKINIEDIKDKEKEFDANEKETIKNEIKKPKKSKDISGQNSGEDDEEEEEKKINKNKEKKKEKEKKSKKKDK